MRHAIIFFGTPAFCEPALRALAADGEFNLKLVVTKQDQPVGRGKKLTSPTAKLVADELGIPVLQTKHPGKQPAFDQIRMIGADAFVVVAYGSILPDALLALPQHGVVNAHPSLLPKYRGASPIQAAILNGDSETGVSFILLKPGPVDSGPVFFQRPHPIPGRATCEVLYRELAHAVASELPDALAKYLRDELKPHEQDHHTATYVKLVTSSDGEIDWSRSANEIDRQIRAYTPWPGCSTDFRGKRLKIRKTKPSEKHSELPPGTFFREGKELLVACGNGALHVLEVQIEGRAPMDGLSFLNGYLK